MDLGLALLGDLQKTIDAEIAAGERAVTLGVKRVGDGMKEDLRRDTASLGKKVTNAWRADLYPRGQHSLGAASHVYTKAPKMMQGFAEGSVIRSKEGRFLAIPTENAPKKGVGRKRISPDNFPEHRFGKLRFVYRQNGPSLLVVDNLRKSASKRGGFIKASEGALKKGFANSKFGSQGITTVVMFILVPQVQMPKLFDFDRSAEKWLNRLPEMILKEWENGD